MRKLLVITALLFFQSCGTVDYNIPRARHISPEVTGAPFKGAVSGHIGTSGTHQTAAVYDTIIFGPSISTESYFNDTATLGANIKLGLLERVDFYTRVNFDSSNIYGLQFQFLGGTQKEIGYKASIGLGYGKETVDDYVVALTDTNLYDVNLNLEAIDSFINFGYRFNKHVLTYVTGYYTKYNSKSSLNGSTQNYTVYNDTNSYGALLGYRFEYKFISFDIEAGVGKDKDESSSEEIEYGFVSTNIGYYW